MATVGDSTYKHNGRIIYVEPNLMRGDRTKEGNILAAPPDIEDYCISVDLQVEVKDRVQSTKGGSDSTIYVMSYTNGTKNGSHISFLQGSKLPIKSGSTSNGLALTTSFTDISYDEPQNGGIGECFGISSIDINFDSWYTPTVTMRFTDVRGVSLFGPEEYAHRDDKIDKNAPGSFFKCFFTFPYPKFTLQVKGFYGEAVTYQLTCSSFKSNFNSQTGNFEVEVQFLGYNYSLLTDIPMHFLKAAPYSEYEGMDYWTKNAVQGGRFSIGEGSENQPMLTLIDLCNKIANSSEELIKLSSESPIVRERVTYQKRMSHLLEIKDAFNRFYNKILKDDKVVVLQVMIGINF